jgi:hypothetical protein
LASISGPLGAFSALEQAGLVRINRRGGSDVLVDIIDDNAASDRRETTNRLDAKSERTKHGVLRPTHGKLRNRMQTTALLPPTRAKVPIRSEENEPPPTIVDRIDLGDSW